MMKVNDIPKFFPAPPYNINMPWGHIERRLEEWNDDKNTIKGALGLDLDPDFQRGHVWTEEKQIAYIEYCLKGGTYSRLILFNHPGWMGNWNGQMVLVDGKQRLEAVRKFVRNELPVFGGIKLNDFDDPKRLLRSGNCEMIFGVNKLQTRAEVLEWYLQLNDGGVIHTKEELDKVRRLLENEKS